MRAFKDVLEREDLLWEQAEGFVWVTFDKYRRSIDGCCVVDDSASKQDGGEVLDCEAKQESGARAVGDSATGLIVGNVVGLKSKVEESADDEPRGPEPRELNTMVTILKRIQDARRAIHLDLMKLGEVSNDGETIAADDDGEVSRILELLEAGQAEEDSDRVDEEAL